MQRLTYSPKVYAFVKADVNRVKGAAHPHIDVSDFITAGEVQRVLNAASTASLTLRNPKRLWTQPTEAVIKEYAKAGLDLTGHEPGTPVFHPMDPITIYMSRFHSRPVQVFTGYLDTTPYFQIYPGTATIQASCTLKRLLYTYWDPALTSTMAYLIKKGWFPSQGGLANVAAQAQFLSGKDTTALNDGSIGNLLYSILKDVGNWNDHEILVEPLPSNVVSAVQKIYQVSQKESEQALTEFQTFFDTVIGSSGQGSNSGGGGETPKPGNGQYYTLGQIKGIWIANGGDPAEASMAAAIAMAESGGDPNNTNYNTNGTTDRGLWQINSIHGSQSTYNVPANAKAAISISKNGSDWTPWSTYTNGRYAQFLSAAEAAAVDTSGTGAPKSDNRASNNGSTNGKLAQLLARDASAPAPVSKKTDQSSTSDGKSALANIFPYGTDITLERADMGVDLAIADGIPVGAIASGTVSVPDSNWFTGTDGQPQPFIMVTLDTPINGYNAWYIAEGVHPTKTSGHVSAGEQIAVTRSHGTGIETGWADASTGNAAASSHYNEGDQTEEAINFASYIGVPALASGTTRKLDWKTLKPGQNTGSPSGSSAGGTSGDITSASSAAAFAVNLAFPTVEDIATASVLTGQHSLLNDQPLLPFIQQLTAACLRSFCSLPNGTFFAFFPDYFGELRFPSDSKEAGLDKGSPYWNIPDIEIIDCKIQLSDAQLATHVYVVGDTIPQGGIINEITSSVVSIFDAFDSGFVNIADAKDPLKDRINALEFLKRYGARPYVNQEASMIRSPYYEAFMAFQTFQLMWARQFQTTCEFTFMPELFPGGRVGFPDHGFQCYIDSVTHTFDYESGFTTTAELEAPSALPNAKSGVSRGLVRSDFLTTSPAPKKGSRKSKRGKK